MLGFAFSLRYLSPFQALLCALGACAFNLWGLPHARNGRILRQSERSPLGSGPFFYSSSVLMLILMFSRHLHIVAGAWAVMALGDGTAGLSGRPPQRFLLPWNSRKSILGSIRFVVFGTLGAFVMIVWTLRSSPQNQFSLIEISSICLGVSFCCAVIESLPWKLNDNLTVPLAAGVLFFLLLHTSLLSVLRGQDFSRSFAEGLLANLFLVSVAWLLGWIRASGAIAGVLLGTSIFVFLGTGGLTLLLAFLILGSISTKLGYRSKRELGMPQSHRGARGAKEALANGSLPALLAVLACVTPNGSLFLIGFISALAAATADTVSSEIGQWIGGEPFLITNLARVRPGTDGAITIKGTLSGIVAACLLGLLAVQLGMISLVQFWIVQVAGLAGNLTDSFLGASVEGSNGVDNESVNFLNTVAGAGTGMALEWWMRHGLAS
jgi:uncharacterized protein (TIGR00297 family)